MSNNDITKQNYAQWLEETLREVLELPVDSICISVKLTGGAVYTSYSDECTMMDKLQFSGVIQQDAMLDMMRTNGLVKDEDEDDTD